MSKFFISSLVSLFLCLVSSTNYAHILNIDPQTVEAKAWIILDPQSQQVIAEYQSDEIRAPASLTKMMVSYIALNAIKEKKLTLNQIVTVPDVVNTVKWDESRLQLKPQEQITVQALIEGLIIMSANDAALTLGTLISGDTQSFLDLMNQTAQQLGMANTHFSNPSGITMQDHYSTAYDMALLSQAIVRETPEYLQYSKRQEFRYKDLYHEATNILLKKDSSVDGLKTGYTQAAGYNLALTANRLDQNTNEYRRLIVVVMGTASKQKRADVAENLMNIAFTYTQNKRLFTHEQVIAEIPVLNSSTSFYPVKLQSSKSYHTLSLMNNQQLQLDSKQFDAAQQRFVIADQILEPLTHPEHMSYTVQLLQPQLQAPLAKQLMPLVKIDVKQFDQSIHQLEITGHIELEKANWWQKIMLWFKSLIQSIQGYTPQAIIYPIASQ